MPQLHYPRIRLRMRRDNTGRAHWVAYRVHSPTSYQFPVLAREALSDAHTAATRLTSI